MKLLIPLFALSSILLCNWSAHLQAQQLNQDYYKLSRQLILVTTDNWDAVPGRLRRFTRQSHSKHWHPVGDSISVVVGKNGLGWGLGLLSISSAVGPVKKEGDGKSPAGVFKLSSAFGYAPKDEATRIKMPYKYLTTAIECVDDVNSGSYNQIMAKDSAAKVDWNSSEQMRRSDDQYLWGIVVDHNANPPQSGSGSCIFMHIWHSPESGTAGCTAMERKNLEAILFWLDPAKKPALIQLPESEYHRLATVLGVP